MTFFQEVNKKVGIAEKVKNAALAAATARSTSASFPKMIVPIWPSVAGLRIGMALSLSGTTQSPFT